MDESRNEHYGYFEQKLSKWDIIEFLEQCDLEPYSKKENKPDQQHVKDWEKTRKSKGLRERKVVSYAESSTDTDTSFYSNCEEFKSVKKQSNRFDIKESTTYNDKVEKLEYDSYLYSFIINDADIEAKKLFNKNEWNEIFFSNPKQVPKIDKKIVNLLKKYNVDNLPILQKVIFEHLFSDNASYSTDLDYINLVYREKDDFTSASKLEGWFEMNIWAHLVDSAFHEMETDLVRGKGMCLSSSDRKNTDRSEND
ncbi:17833_t:CDS:2 [Cetraspora pellucida]|uniref:17833_t:CDS:1 n=1 Tax=Cetraspora pellucida TaxID=1433469 RepID=A0ACA9NKM4_9GLOM|nr:17833_t:CDS:2 [Cetraspora pellucida]